MYKITLSNNTVISNLRLNGNNYISSVPLTAEIFDFNCAPVRISDGENVEVHANMELVQITEQVAGEYWFVLRDIPASETEMKRIKADIEYIAMIADVEL